jgi:acetyl-CoA C-acetyltransferase
MKVNISGASVSKFGELWGVSPRDLVREVVDKALVQADLATQDIDGVFVGNMLSGVLGGQDHLGAFFSDELGIYKGAVSIEGACASGGLAVHSGVMAILSGLYDHVLVVGVEKMTDHKPEDVARGLMGAGSDAERESGATFPSLYALMARAHMQKWGTTEEEMAAVSVKNHYHASLNPNAQFPFPTTIEKVMKSSCIASPLKLLDCSPITDGAAAIVLSKHETRNTKNEVSIIASSVETDALGVAQRQDLTTLDATVRSAKEAYSQAGINPTQIQLAEVHDCFSIAEILAMEDLGFFEKGKAAKSIFDKKTYLGQKLAVNTSGGLKACGHPVGATGVKQIVEIYEQLSGLSGKRQVADARYGLTHNVGGSGATAVVHILEKK